MEPDATPSPYPYPSPVTASATAAHTQLVVALDPGRLSGVVTAQITREGELCIEYFQEIAFTPNGLYKYLVGRCPDILVVERFTYRPKHAAESGLDLYPCFLLGVCHLFVEQRGIELVQQEASEAKSGYYGKDDTLSELGVYSKGGKGHARDATRHLLRWFYEGDGYAYNKSGVQSKGMTKGMQTEKQKHPVRTRPRNNGEIEF